MKKKKLCKCDKCKTARKKHKYYLRNKKAQAEFESSPLFLAYRNLRLLLSKRKHIEMSEELHSILLGIKYQLKDAIKEKRRLLKDLKDN